MKIKGKKITFCVSKRRLPTGKWATLDIVEHPGAALIVPFLTNNKIVFIRQFRAVLGKYLYELPAGTLDKNERPFACAKREIVEETGYSAGKLIKLGFIYPVPGYSTEIIHIFRAEKLSRKVGNKDADEIIAPIVLSRPQIRKYFRSGKIRDAKTVCALAFSGLL